MLFNERIKCSECPIRHRAVCARCDDDELSKLEAIKSYRSYKAGEPILWRGDDLSHMSSVVDGIATLTKTLEDGRTQVVGLLLPSDFIGRPGREEIDFDVTAVTDVTLCRFERRPFERLVIETPHLSQRLMEMALDELDAARDWMVLLGRKTAREKIATFLEMLMRRSHLQNHEVATVALPLTRDEIANFLGLTLETVSRQLTALRKDGVIAFTDRRHFVISDLAALHEATGDDADGGLIV
ncbi:MAG: transcriptional regulator FnrL [Paracoccaceae bacterium]